MKHCEEDRIFKPVEAQEVLIEKENADVGEVP